ncbi:MAG: fasciclin domain-containing protein [Elainellaceae cyanobacterium]
MKRAIAIGAAGLILGAAAALPGRAAIGARAMAPLAIAHTTIPAQMALDATNPSYIADAQLDIVDAAERQGLSIFVSLLKELGIAEDLRGYGRFTVFAPSDSALTNFFLANPQFQDELTGLQRDQLAMLLSYHVIARAEPITTDNFASVLGSRTAAQRTLARPDVNLRLRGGDIYVNGADVLEPDIEAANGVIHLIDRVLVPPDGI